MPSRVIALSLSGLLALVPIALVTHSVFVSLSDVPLQSAELESAEVRSTGAMVAPRFGGPMGSSLTQPGEDSPTKFHRVGRPIEVSERQFERLSARGLVLVKFGADWCGPCRQVDSELQQLAHDNAGELTVLTVDIDQERRLSERHDIGPIPHMILLRDGEQIGKWTGYQSASRLQRQVDEAKPPKGKVQTNPFTT